MSRVAIVNDVAGVGRLEVEALRMAGWEADFLDLPKPGARWPRWLKPIALPLRLLLAIPVVWRLRRGGYEIVHVHFVSQGFAGAASGRPYFLHAHGSDLHANLARPLLRAWSRIWMRGARGIFYVTPNLRAFLGEFAAKATLLPNPVDTAQFKDVPVPDRLDRVLLFMRLDPVKGAPTAFAAVDRLSKLVRLGAMDWGSLAAEYRTKFGDRVEFMEPVPPEDVPSLLARFDGVIGQMKQGVAGLSELQALAAGRAVLMRLDGELVGEDRPPVVQAANEDQLVEGVLALRENPGELSRLASTGREWVERHHGLGAHARALIEAYGEVSPATGAKA